MVGIQFKDTGNDEPFGHAAILTFIVKQLPVGHLKILETHVINLAIDEWCLSLFRLGEHIILYVQSMGRTFPFFFV